MFDLLKNNNNHSDAASNVFHPASPAIEKHQNSGLNSRKNTRQLTLNTNIISKLFGSSSTFSGSRSAFSANDFRSPGSSFIQSIGYKSGTVRGKLASETEKKTFWGPVQLTSKHKIESKKEVLFSPTKEGCFLTPVELNRKEAVSRAIDNATTELDLSMFSDIVDDSVLLKIATEKADLQCLNLAACQKISDDGLAFISILNTLQKLNLSECTHISHVGLSLVSQLPHLWVLNLTACHQISEPEIIAISASKSIADLHLSDCASLTDACLQHLQKLESLEKIRLNGNNQLTDQGIEHLCAMKKLLLADFASTNSISDEALGLLLVFLETNARFCTANKVALQTVNMEDELRNDPTLALAGQIIDANTDSYNLSIKPIIMPETCDANPTAAVLEYNQHFDAAADQSSDKVLLAVYALCGDELIRSQVAGNSGAPALVLSLFEHEQDQAVLLDLMRNPATPLDLINCICHRTDLNESVQAEIASRLLNS